MGYLSCDEFQSTFHISERQVSFLDNLQSNQFSIGFLSVIRMLYIFSIQKFEDSFYSLNSGNKQSPFVNEMKNQMCRQQFIIYDKGVINMLNHILLKLIWSRFTTAQIHLLLKLFRVVVKQMNMNECIFQKIFVSFQRIKIDAKVNRYKEISVDEIETTIQKTQLNYITCFDHNYPYLLKETYNYPIILFYKGNINLLSYPHTLAVVGSRLSGDYTLKALNHLFVSFQQMSFVSFPGLLKELMQWHIKQL